MERFAAIDFEIANGKRSSICSIGVAIIEDNKVIDSVYTLVRPYPNFYTRFTTAIHGITMQDTIDSPDFEEAWARIAGRDCKISHWLPITVLLTKVACRQLTKPMTLPIPNISFIAPAVCQGACILSWLTTNYRLLPLIADTI